MVLILSSSSIYDTGEMTTMNNMDAIVTAIGIIYGFVLILVTFVRNKFIEPMRIDALFIPQPTDSTRPVNLIVGIMVSGYGIYSLLTK